MGFFNKIVKKGDKSKKQATDQQASQKLKVKERDVSKKKDLSVAELKERGEKSSSATMPAGKQETSDGKKDVKKSVKETTRKDDTKESYKVLVRPLITEKGTYLGSQNKYVFEVTQKSNKIEIKKAIKAVYGVTPIKVNIINTAGKKVRYGRIKGKTKDIKKAVVTLKDGESIQVYEGV